MTQEARLELSDVQVQVPGKILLQDINVSFEPGMMVALIGPNGAGKTTLLKTALGLIKPQRGEVTLGGRPLATLTPRERAALMGWLPQHNQVSEPLDAWEVVAAARYRHRESLDVQRKAALSALAEVDALDLANRRFSVLSGGERQRVVWATLIAQDVPMLFLDEPASHLDPAQQGEAYRRVGQRWRQGHGILCITHDVNLLSLVGPAEKVRIVGLDQGRIVLQTHLNDPDLAARLSQLFHITIRAIEQDGRRLFYPHLEASA